MLAVNQRLTMLSKVLSTIIRVLMQVRCCRHTCVYFATLSKPHFGRSQDVHGSTSAGSRMDVGPVCTAVSELRLAVIRCQPLCLWKFLRLPAGEVCSSLTIDIAASRRRDLVPFDGVIADHTPEMICRQLRVPDGGNCCPCTIRRLATPHPEK